MTGLWVQLGAAGTDSGGDSNSSSQRLLRPADSSPPRLAVASALGIYAA